MKKDNIDKFFLPEFQFCLPYHTNTRMSLILRTFYLCTYMNFESLIILNPLKILNPPDAACLGEISRYPVKNYKNTKALHLFLYSI